MFESRRVIETPYKGQLISQASCWHKASFNGNRYRCSKTK